MQLSGQQEQAVRAAIAWYRDPTSKPWFYLGGYAGTGKSTCAKTIVRELVGLEHCVSAAPTAKAASVVSKKGLPGTRTMHSVLYRPKNTDEELEDLEQELEMLKLELSQVDDDGNKLTELEVQNHPKVTQLEGQLAVAARKAKIPKFVLNEASDLVGAKLGLLDEVSMVGADLAKDWLSFGVKTLVMGDPGQLPPVTGEGYFTRHQPDFMLTEIHRQAADNPVIRLSAQVRAGAMPRPGQWGGSSVTSLKTLDRDQLGEVCAGWADQMIVGKNETRKMYNKAIRRSKRMSGLVAPGEKLVGLANDRDRGLMNGVQYEVLEVRDHYEYDRKIDLVVREWDSDDDGQLVRCHDAYFRGQEPKASEYRKARPFDLGWAMTCHKAQGSQWPNVAIMFQPVNDWRKWLYTAMTRVEESFHILLP